MATSVDLWPVTNRPLLLNFKRKYRLLQKGDLILWWVPVIRSSQCYPHSSAYYREQSAVRTDTQKVKSFCSSPRPLSRTYWDGYDNPVNDKNIHGKSWLFCWEGDDLALMQIGRKGLFGDGRAWSNRFYLHPVFLLWIFKCPRVTLHMANEK